MRFKILLVLLLAASTAQATNYNKNYNANTNVSKSYAAQDQEQDQNQEQTQKATAEQSQTAGGGDSTLTDQSTNTVNTDYKRNAPSINAPAISPTVPCYKTGGLSLGFPGGGGSIGGGKIDKGCEEREVARLMAEMGAVTLALAMLCESEAVERTIGVAQCLGNEDTLERVGAEQFVNPPPPVIEVFTNLTPACGGEKDDCGKQPER